MLHTIAECRAAGGRLDLYAGARFRKRVQCDECFCATGPA